MKPKSVRLFVKPFCGWCSEAEEWLQQHGIEYERLNVITNGEARREMHELTGQSRAPSIDVDGHILADFGVDELEPWWRELGYDA